MKKILLTATLLLPLFGLWGQVWGWDGSGTSEDPYLIQTSADWAELSTQVAAGNAYGDKYFMMSNDIDTQGCR